MNKSLIGISMGNFQKIPAFAVGWLLFTILLSSCIIGSDDSNCMNGTEKPCIPPDEPHKMLSEYRIYEGEQSNLEPVDDLLPYDLNTQLFSDYAQKLRLVYVPEGTSVSYKNKFILEFPVGSMLVKNFFYNNDFRDSSSERMIIETRLLIRKEIGWTAERYV